MFTVYVLKDDADKYYKGVTNNLKRRLYEHRIGCTRTTSRMKNLKLVYKEEFPDFKKARKREVYLKSGAGRRYLKKMGL